MNVRWLGREPVEYLPVWQAMRAYTDERGPDDADALWLVQHQPVYTLGQAASREHLLAPGDIPVVPTDRGGQVTYHGPGQVVAYPLFDLKRAGYFVKEYVNRLEAAVIGVLADLGLPGAHRVAGAPGVYVALDGGMAKIAALGVKVRNGRTYHGVALNVNMDLGPFLGINPCGYAGLRTVDLAACGMVCTVEEVGERLADSLVRTLPGVSVRPVGSLVHASG